MIHVTHERAAQIVNAVHAHENHWDIAMDSFLKLFEGEPDFDAGDFKTRCFELFSTQQHDTEACAYKFCSYKPDEEA